MEDVTFTVICGGESETWSDFEDALDSVETLIERGEPVSIISSSGERWDAPELTDLLARRRSASSRRPPRS